MLGGVAASAAVVIGISWVRPVEAERAEAGAGAPSSSSSSSPSSSVRSVRSSPVVPDAARVWPDEPVEVEGTEVRTGGHRWSVGEPGDLVAVGDWDCDGTSTPAVLRPTAGRVFVFDAWAEGSEVAAVPGPSAPTDAVGFEAVGGCGRAEVRTSSGAVVAVETVSGE